MADLPSHVAALRRHDRDRYQSCLFAPAAVREHLFALYAFNYEIAKTAEVVSEPMLGQIRLQWWRDSIDGIYAGTPRAHEVVEPLARAVAATGLSREGLEALVTAREFDLEGDPPQDLAALEDYAAGTSSRLILLALQVLAVESPAAEQAARDLGLAWAYLGLLRAMPFHARQKRLFLPADLCREAGLGLGDFFELRRSEALVQVSRQLSELADRHLRKARENAKLVPRKALSALLLAPLAERTLKRLEKAGYDPFHPSLQSEAPGQVWRLAWAAWRGRY